jgi:hypothetical protein
MISRPRRPVIRKSPPRTPVWHHVTPGVAKLSQEILSLWSIFFHKHQIRRAKRPLFLDDVTGITSLVSATFETFFTIPSVMRSCHDIIYIRSSQLRENFGAVDVIAKFTPDILDRLNTLVAPVAQYLLHNTPAHPGLRALVAKSSSRTPA